MWDMIVVNNNKSKDNSDYTELSTNMEPSFEKKRVSFNDDTIFKSKLDRNNVKKEIIDHHNGRTCDISTIELLLENCIIKRNRIVNYRKNFMNTSIKNIDY